MTDQSSFTVRTDRRLIRAGGRSDRFLLVELTRANGGARPRPPAPAGQPRLRRRPVGLDGRPRQARSRQAGRRGGARPTRGRGSLQRRRLRRQDRRRRAERTRNAGHPLEGGSGARDRRTTRVHGPRWRVAGRLRPGRPPPPRRRRQPLPAPHRWAGERRDHRPRRAGSARRRAAGAGRRDHDVRRRGRLRRGAAPVAWPTPAAATSTSSAACRRSATTSPARSARRSRSSRATSCSRSTAPETVEVEPMTPFRTERRGSRTLDPPRRPRVRAGAADRAPADVPVRRGRSGDRRAHRRSPTGTARSARPSPRSPRWRSAGPTTSTRRTTRSRATSTSTGPSRRCSPHGRARRPSDSTEAATSPRRRWRCQGVASRVREYGGSDAVMRGSRPGSRARRRRRRADARDVAQADALRGVELDAHAIVRGQGDPGQEQVLIAETSPTAAPPRHPREAGPHHARGLRPPPKVSICLTTRPRLHDPRRAIAGAGRTRRASRRASWRSRARPRG